jgi:4-hydroxy-3-methylbut-2-enyl diphosphate reductase
VSTRVEGSRRARTYAAQGYTLVIIGHAEHEEIEGTMGEAPESRVLVESRADVERIEPGRTDRLV